LVSVKAKILVLFFILTLFGCSTEQEAVRDIPEYNEAIVAKIRSYLEQGLNEKVIQVCSVIDNPGVSEYRTQALNGLEADYKKALADKKYEAAAEYLQSLGAAGVQPDSTPQELYLMRVIQLLDEDAVTPALALFQARIINTDASLDIPAEQVDQIAAAALSNRNKVVVRYLTEKYPENEFKSPEKLEELLSYTPEKEELIKGTVTIWVNRGIKLQGGIGYPDRVIGSGFYIDKRGYILTNYHVISSEVDPEYEGYSRLYIKYDENEERIPAAVVGWDASLDIALLKVIYTPDYIYSFPEKREYKPGEKIYAIGSPGGLDKTITSGIISASGNRRLLPIGDTIQVDVPINSGNSGGPVVDESGNLVGVAFAGIEQFEGVNFIIPADWILGSLLELYNEGRDVQSWFGLTVHEGREGLEIMYIMPGTSAFSTNLQAGEIITGIDGISLSSIPAAQAVVQTHKPGTLLNITVMHDESEKTVMLQVEDRKDMPMKKALELDSKKNLMSPFLGMIVDEAEDDVIGREFVIRKVYRGSPADETGLSIDDPFSIVSWNVDTENKVLIVGIKIKKRKAGFIESVIQLGNYIDINNTI